MTLLIACAAPFAAQYFRDERVTLSDLGLCPAASSSRASAISASCCSGARWTSSPSSSSSSAARLVGFALGLGAALWLRNYWALVIGILAGIVATTVLAMRCTHSGRAGTFRGGENYGASRKWMFVVNIAQFAEARADEAVVGRLGAESLGLYAVGSDLGQMPVNEIAAPVNRVLFPAFASVQDDPERIRVAYLRTLEIVASVTVPAGARIGAGR